MATPQSRAEHDYLYRKDRAAGCSRSAGTGSYGAASGALPEVAASPAGVLVFEGQRINVPALIMVSLDAKDPNLIDRKLADRLSCNLGQRWRLDASVVGSAISFVSCQISDWFGDAWLSLAIGKSDSASYPDFCRQVQELTKDTDVAEVVRGSPEGSKGLYVRLPPACEALQ